MNGYGEKFTITPPGSNFHNEIITKYQTRKLSTFRFPKMVFYKNIGYLHPEMFNMNFLFHLHITNKTIIPSFTVKILPFIKVMISWFNSKNDLQYVMRLNNVQNINNKTEIFQTASVFSWLNKLTSRFFPIFNTKENLHSEMKLKNIQNVNTETNIFKIALKVPWLYQFILSLFQTFNTKDYLHSGVKLNSFQKVNSEIKILQKAMELPWLYQYSSRHFSTFNTKNVLYSEMVQKNIQNVNNKTDLFLTALEIPGFCNFISGSHPSKYIHASRISIIPLSKSLFLKSKAVLESKAVLDESNKLLKLLFLNSKTAHYQLVNPVLSDTLIMNTQTLRHGNSMRSISPYTLRAKTKLDSVNATMYSIASEKKLLGKYQFLFDCKSYLNLSHDSLLFNHKLLFVNRLLFEHPKLLAVNKPLIKNNYFSLDCDKSNFPLNNYAYNTGEESLHFRDTKNIEQEIENIKKVAIETKESVLDKIKSSIGEADIKRYIDINRISDQVYQNIERTIRMERDRRGM